MIEINNILDVVKYIDDIKVVVFDLDDTLYNEIDYMKSGFRKILEYLNINYKLNLDIDKTINKMIEYYIKRYKPIDKLLVDNNIYSNDVLKICLELYRSHKPKISLDKNVEKMLLIIKGSQKNLGLITDGRVASQNEKIVSLGIEKYFNKIIITDELGGVEFRKPNSISYNIMKDYFNVGYRDMCYVGDNINKDFIFPEKVGIKSILYKNEKGIKNIYNKYDSDYIN